MANHNHNRDDWGLRLFMVLAFPILLPILLPIVLVGKLVLWIMDGPTYGPKKTDR